MLFDVSSAAGLASALALAQGGDVVSLAAGNYGDVTIAGLIAGGAGDIHIRSADALDPATFHFLHVSGSARLSFEELDLRHPLAAGEAAYASALRIDNSSFISVLGNDFAGSVDDDYLNDGLGLLVLGSDHVTVAGNDFHDLATGSSIGTSKHVTVSGNSYFDIRLDGAVFGAVSSVALTANTFSDFHTATELGDHPDMVQFFNNGATEDMADILIAGNVLSLGATGSGASPQGIFIQGRPSASFPYEARDVVIEGNVIENGSGRGISVSGAFGVTIGGNTVVRAASTPTGYTPAIALSDVQTGSVTGNQAPAFSETGSSGIAYDGNAIVGGNNGSTWANIYGTGGDDTVLVCGGRSRVGGRGGDDHFVVPSDVVRSIFADFDVFGAAHDVIDLTSLGLDPVGGVAAYILARTTYSGGTSTITLPGGRLIQLSDLDLRSASAEEIAAAFLLG